MKNIALVLEANAQVTHAARLVAVAARALADSPYNAELKAELEAYLEVYSRARAAFAEAIIENIHHALPGHDGALEKIDNSHLD